MPLLLLTPHERIGTLVGARYELLRIVGEGASAVLYAARDRALGREVGVKAMSGSRALASEEQRDRFRREAQTLARLRHPHLVEVFDVGETDDGMPFVVVELLHGETLAALLERTPQLGVEEALAITLPLMGALACAHDAGVIHRDVKPANIFLHERGSAPVVPKLLDFGIAKLSEQGATMTGEGRTLGTPSFMAPEQARGEALTAATDVWAMGVTMYLCLSGRLPFDAPTPAGILLQAAKEGLPDLRVADLDPSVALAVECALRIDPARRTPDMRSFARSLVLTARRAGITLPVDPEPIGLPDYKNWNTQVAGEQATAEFSVARTESPPVTSAHAAPAPAQPRQSIKAADAPSALHAPVYSFERPSSGDALIRGHLFAGVPEFVRLRFGAHRFREFLERVEPTAARTWAEGLEPLAWYPFAVAASAVDTIVAMSDKASVQDTLRGLSRHNLDRATNLIFRAIFKLGSPEFMVGKSDQVWKKYYSTGRMVVAHESWTGRSTPARLSRDDPQLQPGRSLRNRSSDHQSRRSHRAGIPHARHLQGRRFLRVHIRVVRGELVQTQLVQVTLSASTAKVVDLMSP